MGGSVPCIGLPRSPRWGAYPEAWRAEVEGCGLQEGRWWRWSCFQVRSIEQHVTFTRQGASVSALQV